MALGHPTRAHIANVLAKRVASVKEVTDELDCDIRHVEYHLKELRRIGWVEPVEGGGRSRDNAGRWAPARYRKTSRLWIDHAAWQAVDPSGQAAMTAALMQDINADIAEAAKAGTLNGSDNHISRTVLAVDEQGFAEVRELLDETLDKAIAIEERSANRLHGRQSVTAKVEIVHFRAPEQTACEEA